MELVEGMCATRAFTPAASSSRTPPSRPRASQRLSFLIAFTQYLFDSLHDWHLKIFLVAAIIRHLAQLFFQTLQIDHSVVALGTAADSETIGTIVPVRRW
jgi:hypothetical protein